MRQANKKKDDEQKDYRRKKEKEVVKEVAKKEVQHQLKLSPLIDSMKAPMAAVLEFLSILITGTIKHDIHFFLHLSMLFMSVLSSRSD